MFETIWPFKSNGNNHKTTTSAQVTIDEHLLSVDQVVAKYETNLEHGLTNEKVGMLIKKHGLNRLTPSKKTPEIVKFLKHLTGGFSALLWTGAILCWISYFISEDNAHDDNLYLGFTLMAVVVITGAFAYYQESKSSAIIESFKQLIPQNAHVIRDGKLIEIDSKQIVAGDIIEIIGGNQVPCDIRLFQAFGCKFDNSSLTGESEPQIRHVSNQNVNPLEAENLAFFSSYCTEGRGRGIAIRTGDSTVIGQIANLSQQQTSETTIAKEIRLFIRKITIFAFCVGATFFVLSLIIGYSMIHAIIFFIGIIVANVPEGLLATVTVCLTLTANSLRKKNCLVKNLEAVETLGSTSIICSDKTGTLTQNKMQVSHVWFNNIILEPRANRHIFREYLKMSRFDDFLRVTALCSKANRETNTKAHKKVYHGDASEVAFLKLIESIGIKWQKIRNDHPLIHEIPFNSKNKFHLTVHDVNIVLNNATHKFLVCLKGAPEVVLKLCRSIILNGHCKILNEQTKTDLHKVCAHFASMGERVLAFAELYSNDYGSLLDEKDFQLLNEKFESESQFTLLGIMSLIDPPRPEVPDAVRKCRMAGIRVFMVTGDHPITAQAIAQQVGIISQADILLLNDDSFQQLFENGVPSNSCSIDNGKNELECKSIVITGMMLNKFTNQQLDYIIKNYQEIVFARVSPQQKLSIVESCQRLGHIVAATGDGVNDSPALKKANIGISMGINGSDVSKEAADMILMDDNFATIVVGIEEGRVIFDNLRKSIGYVLSSNFAEIIPFIVYVAFGFPLPLGTIAILCIDLGTDIFPSISLAYEKAESDIMRRKPRDPKNDHLVTMKLFHRSYFQIGMIQAAAGLFTYFCVMADHGFYISDLYQLRGVWDDQNYLIFNQFGQGWPYEQRKTLEYTCHTAYFISIVTCQWMDLIISKTQLNSILQQAMINHVLNVSLLVETFLATILVYCPGMKSFLKLYPLKWWYWFLAMPFAIFAFIYDETRRWFIRNSSHQAFFYSETYH